MSRPTILFFFFFSSRRRHTRLQGDWSSDVCSSDLPETRGNAYGIGLADFATSRLIRAIDYRTTAVNSLTAANPEAAALPIHFESDREVIDAALASAGLAPPERARVVRIRNTLHLDRLLVSEVCRAELAARAHVEIIEPPHELAFDEAGEPPPH